METVVTATANVIRLKRLNAQKLGVLNLFKINQLDGASPNSVAY